MDTATIGICCGAALVSAEVISFAAVAVARETMQRRCPRIARACGIGVKTTSYRVFAGLDTILINLLVTGNLSAAVGVAGFELMSKFFLYYGHEWLWSLPFLARLTSNTRSQS